jgi:ADP-heptose:LPS heptosyltransferase
MHLADAVGTPCIGLLGSYNLPKMWHPSGAATNIIHRMDGLAVILPDEVLEASMQVLDRTAAESTI